MSFREPPEHSSFDQVPRGGFGESDCLGPIDLVSGRVTIRCGARTVPNNHRPSSSIAWMLLIVVTPILGLMIFLLIGSPFVRGRRPRSRLSEPGHHGTYCQGS